MPSKTRATQPQPSGRRSSTASSNQASQYTYNHGREGVNDNTESQLISIGNYLSWTGSRTQGVSSMGRWWHWPMQTWSLTLSHCDSLS